MKEYITQDRQSLLDIGLQLTGSVEGAVQIAQSLNLSLSDDLEMGTEIVYDESIVIDSKAVTIYNRDKTTPATAIEDWAGGIGAMGIEVNFFVR